MHVPQPFQSSRLCEKVCIRPNRRRPAVLISGMLNAPENVNAPRLYRSVLIPQALERNPYFDFVSTLHQSALRLEQIIWIQIHAALERIDVAGSTACRGSSPGSSRELGTPRSVLLHAERVDSEEECELASVLGV